MADPVTAPPPTNANGDMSHRPGPMGPAGGPSAGKKFEQLAYQFPGMITGAAIGSAAPAAGQIVNAGVELSAQLPKLMQLRMPSAQQIIVTGAEQGSKLIASLASAASSPAEQIVSPVIKQATKVGGNIITKFFLKAFSLVLPRF